MARPREAGVSDSEAMGGAGIRGAARDAGRLRQTLWVVGNEPSRRGHLGYRLGATERLAVVGLRYDELPAMLVTEMRDALGGPDEPPPSGVRRQVEEGIRAVIERDYEKATALLEMALDADPGNRSVRHQLRRLRAFRRGGMPGVVGGRSVAGTATAVRRRRGARRWVLRLRPGLHGNRSRRGAILGRPLGW